MARRINLVPASERARTTTNVAALGMVAAVIIVIFGLGLGYYMFRNDLNDRKEELVALQQETQTLRNQVAALKKFDVLASNRQRAEATVQGIYGNRTLFSDFLNSLSLVSPENVWLSTLDLSAADPSADAQAGSGSVDLAGTTYSFEDVAQLLVRLQLIPAISGVSLLSAGESGTAGSEAKTFSVSASLAKPSEEAVLPVSLVEVE